MARFLDIDMGPPLHSFIICAEKLHSMEQEMYDHFQNKPWSILTFYFYFYFNTQKLPILTLQLKPPINCNLK